jgi:hypothetical protein
MMAFFNPKVYFVFAKAFLLDPMLTQVDSQRILMPNLSKIHFNVVLPPTFQSVRLSLQYFVELCTLHVPPLAVFHCHKETRHSVIFPSLYYSPLLPDILLSHLFSGSLNLFYR